MALPAAEAWQRQPDTPVEVARRRDLLVSWPLGPAVSQMAGPAPHTRILPARRGGAGISARPPEDGSAALCLFAELFLKPTAFSAFLRADEKHPCIS